MKLLTYGVGKGAPCDVPTGVKVAAETAVGAPAARGAPAAVGGGGGG